MPDPELTPEILRQISESCEVIRKRCTSITSANDFLKDDEGLEKLDAACMRLIAIGESVKNLDKITGGLLLPSRPEIDWKKIMGMRDVITHHYFDMDAEVVFNVCKNHLGPLAYAISGIQKEMTSKKL